MIRNGQNNKRMRGRNNRNNNPNNNNNGGGNNHNRGHHNPLTRVYESNGPEVKIRGTAHTIAEKYLQLARDASSSGDHVTAEAHYQHAEHYFRLIAAAQEQFRQQNPNYQPPQIEGRDDNLDDGEDGQSQQQQNPQNAGGQQNFNQQQNFSNQQSFNSQQNFNNNQQGYGGQQNSQPREQQQHQPAPREQQQPQRDPREMPQPYQQSRPQPQPHYQPQQPQPQPVAPQPQPQPQYVDSSRDVERLPSFITGGQPVQAVDANGENQDFVPHRRRRRHRSGPPNAPQDGAPSDGPDDSRPAGE